MSLERRKKPIHGDGSLALTPNPIANQRINRSDDRTMITWWKRLLYQERKRHGQVETILTRQIIQLERQVDDLRKLYFGTISVPIMPKTEETTIHEHSNEINKKGNN
jgi:hypothetical protein